MDSLIFDGVIYPLWLVAPVVSLLVYVLLSILRNLFVTRYKKLEGRVIYGTKEFFIQEVASTRRTLIAIVSIYIGALLLNLQPGYFTALRTLTVIAILLQVGLWLSGLLNFLIARRSRAEGVETSEGAGTLGAVSLIARVVAWTIIFLVILDNVPGVEVTALIASLGIGGIAIGLAVQNILSDLFASLSIVLDKPFVVGDFITVGDLSGTVEQIGLKSTRVRSVSGEQLIFGNSDLLQSRIKNFKRLYRRRALFALRVPLDTPYEKLQRIPLILKDIVSVQPSTTFSRAHFKTYSEFSIDYEIEYFVEASDFTLFMDIQQAINLEVFRRFSEEGVRFAYPTRAVVLENHVPPGQVL